ncbi:MFS polyamine transporter [Rickenella mellea]|uniref:MFS polyamine transporter n=1 Tax=Rickenella mellea TaxID=50990 RepID=A0A4Y7Q3Y5_9AGAM|nr:MFS polyamine transporter [Rickenella mellea]
MASLTTGDHHIDGGTPQPLPRSSLALIVSILEPRPPSSQGVVLSIKELSVKTLEDGKAVKIENDAIIVDWNGHDDPQNPMNWSFKRKWAATATASAFCFISVISSTIVAPAASQVAKEFGITNAVVIAMTTSIFLLGYALGPLVIAPLSEIYGRSPVLQIAKLFYLVWNIACGFAKSENQLLAFRFLAGIGGSAPFVVGGGVIVDCWRTEERGKVVAWYTLAPLLGDAIGPVAGAWIAERASWRWVFWSPSIADGLVQVFALLFLRETFAPLLLERKANRMKKELGIPENDQNKIRTAYQSQERHWKRIFLKAISRPFTMLFREPIVQLLGLYMAFVFGIINLMLTTIPTILQDTYHFSIGIAGLHYISLGVGYIFATQISSRITDRLYVYLQRRNGGMGEPEFRLPTLVLGTICLPVGLLLTGWAAQLAASWILPDIGVALIAAGYIFNYQSIQTYLIDAFSIYSASALAAITCLRSLTSFGFPLFAPSMYKALGYGKGATILAVAAIILGCPA